MLAEHDLDGAKRALLKIVCNAMDDLDVIYRQIAADGLIIHKNGKPAKTHPALRVELSLIKFIAKTLTDLFPIEKPRRPVGRPPSGVGITWRQLPDRSR
jgi:hypothetical protein